jgi:glutamate-1-semialdehyde 2,1-aminomutase
MADDIRRNRDLTEAAADAASRYTAANPRSRARHENATHSMPGGNTRSVLFYSPFPLTWASGEGATLTDLDGHSYTDFLGEFTAGLYGHSNPVIRAAMQGALEGGIALGGPNRYDADLAAEICRRFPSIELVRFCNSGTEANLLALSAARAITGRAKIMIFDGAYHGSVFTFGHGGSPLNVPFPFVTASYNDTEGTLALIEGHARDLAAIILEPMMGAGGGIAADLEFLAALRAAADRHGIVLVFDEVMTSRLSPSGLQGATGVIPDMTTLGKYLGGGASFGAFGGRRRLMERFDPRRPDAIGHAGTFNNNVLSMAAGLAGLTQIFTPEAAVKLNARGDKLREDVNRVAAKHGLPFQAMGVGSILALHFHAGRIRRPSDALPHDPAGEARLADLQRLFHLEMIERGFFLARRGFISLALPLTEADCAAFTAAIDDFLSVHGGVIAEGAA